MSSIVQLSLGDVQDYQKLANAIERHEQLREVPLDMESGFFCNWWMWFPQKYCCADFFGIGRNTA
jgi:hypothetical protein